MNASELTTKAYYLSDVVSRDFETVTGSQLSDGLDMLNDLLNEKAAKGNMIPYYSHATFNCVIGQEKYEISGLMDISVLTFIDGSVRYPMKEIGRKEYFGNLRAVNIDSFPRIFSFERTLGGANLYLYFVPDRVYEFEITGKYFLLNVTASTDVTEILDGFYISYLKYALAERICDFYNIEFSQSKRKTLYDLDSRLFEIAIPDMTISKISALTPNNQGVNWAVVNLFNGVLP